MIVLCNTLSTGVQKGREGKKKKKSIQDAEQQILIIAMENSISLLLFPLEAHNLQVTLKKTNKHICGSSGQI